MTSIQIPYKFTPRDYQLELLEAVDSGYNRAIAVWHRRAGKDKTLWNLIIKKALERKGIYYYFFPEYKQGRRVIWDGIDNDGFRFLDHIPNQLIKSTNSQEMKITLIDPTGESSIGSIIQVVGTDDFDKVRGSNPVGCVFSEFAYQNPAAYEVVKPILRANGGWAVFNSTPNGKNHFHKLWFRTLNNDRWFHQFLTVEQTLDKDGNRFVTDEMIEEEREDGMAEEMVQQEYYCDWTANSQGFYYIRYLEDAVKEDRIVDIPYNPEIPVDTWWDIGVGDSTVIWFTQTVGHYVHVIDVYYNKGEGMEHYAKVLQDLPYIFGTHNFPHDMANTEFGTGRSRYEVADSLLGHSAQLNVLQKLSVEDGINAVRVMFPRLFINKTRCEKGIEALYNYHRQWDDKLKQYKDKPVHDWSSDFADAFRYMAIGLSFPNRKRKRNSIESRLHPNIRRNRNFNSWMVA